MHNRYALYGLMVDRSRYILKTDAQYLRLIQSFLKGLLDEDDVGCLDNLSFYEMDFLQKVCAGECEYFMVKDKKSKLVCRVDPKQLIEN